MEQNLQTVLDLIQADANLSEAEKALIIARLKDVDKKMNMDAFRIERGDQLKKTMSVLLDETIEELEHKRIAVEEKNRDLEIEAALERVRTVAMGMRTAADLLNVCQILFEELTGLGFGELRNAMINIVNDEKGSFLNYDFNGNDLLVIQFLYGSHPVIDRQIDITRSAGDAFIEHILTGSDLEDFKAFRVKNGEAPDPKLENIPALYYYFYSIGVGSVGISAFSSLPGEKREILKRFRNVFDLAYRRYADIQLAEAQAREAQIELGLERVRARAMAMQNSGELSDLVTTVSNELAKLDFALSACIINIIDGPSLSNTVWVTGLEEGQPPQRFHMKFEGYPFHNAMWDAWKGKKATYVYTLEGQEKLTYDDYLFTETEFRGISDVAKAGLRALERYVASFTFCNFGGLQTVGAEALSDANLDILARFGKVFDLTYTRFNDLKQAETQAREAQIELALERVRARTMAMHHSEELAETAFILFQQFKELGENPDQATIGIINEEEHVIEYWVTMYGSQINKVFRFSIDEPNVTNRIYKSWKAKKKSLVIELTGKELYDFTTYRASMGGAGFNPAEKRRVINVAFFSKGIINVQSTEARSEESIRLLERFAAVFEGTYTRFLDLKKAEAQAREAQIELALERVRARTMAMQKSDELKEIIKVVYEQLVHLNILAEHAGFIMDYRANDDMHIWLADKHFDPSYITVPFFDSPHWNSFIEAKKKGNDFFAVYSTFEEKNKFYQDLFKLIPGVTDEAKDYYFSCPGLAISTVLLDNVALYIENFSGIPYTDDENSTLMRFGKVFQQTYTRFLDLQKAEAQAREAQIELSLERVRASAMAMHKTDQLLDAAELLYRELTGLGINSMAVTYAIMAGDEKSAAYYSINPVDGKINPVPLDLAHTETEVMRSILSSWKKQETFSKLELDEKATLQHQTYIAEIIQAYFAKHNFDYDFSVEAFLAVSPKKAVIYTFNFTQGYIFIIGSEHLTKPQEEMVMRFAKVFEMTYRRFLDLKQAEEQARESQIQLALERVRARTMAMQKSTELHEVIQLVFEQLQQLNFNIDVANFALNYKETDDFDLLLAVPNGKYPMEIHVPYFKHPVFDRFKKAKKKGNVLIDTLTKDEKDSFFEHFFKYTPGVSEETKASIFGRPGFVRSSVLMKITALTIHNYDGIPYSEAENNTLLRFGQVFEQTYTRFKDLEQAEEQAREAKIEASLERVRSRTMAMQHSDELRDVIQVIYEQLHQLNFQIDSADFNLDYRESDDFNLWVGVPGRPYPAKLHIPYIDHPLFNRIVRAKVKVPAVIADCYTSDQKNTYFKHNFKFSPTLIPAERQNFILSGAGLAISTVLMTNVALSTMNYSGVPYTDADNTTLMRFGKVFEQTYTRFKDLEQAEEQAREAQIQLGLERVRAKAMAMQTSEELNELIGTVFSELTKLDFVLTRCLIMIFDPETKASRWWMANSEAPAEPMNYLVQNHKNPAYDAYLKAWKERNLKWNYALKGKVKRDWDDFLFVDTELAQLPGPVIAGMKAPEQVLLSASFNNFGCLTLVSLEPLSDEHSDIMLRFAKVFDMCYTRFNDLKQAEEQAKESQIQLALERVRAAAMSMHGSKDVSDATAVMFSELFKLDIVTIRSGVLIIEESTQLIEVWAATSPNAGKVSQGSGKVDINKTLLWQNIFKCWKQKKVNLTYELTGQELADYYEAQTNSPDYRPPELNSAYIVPDDPTNARQYCNLFFFAEGAVFAFTEKPFDPATNQVLEKFATVFGLTYRRYQDLQKAEAQAREAQIEAALERVRSKTMAMHNSADVGETVTLMFNELVKLGVDKIARCGIAIPDDNGLIELWTAKLGRDEKEEMIIGHIDTAIHPMLKLLYDAWKSKQPYFEYILEGDDLHNYITALNNYRGYPIKYDTGAWGTKQYHNDFFFHEGMVFAFTFQPLSAEIAAIFKRFAGVFGQTYRRYLDLLKAEAAAREARIEASLERVRGKAMAMRNSNDLSITASMVFAELRNLGINPIRSGVGLITKGTRQAKIYSDTALQKDTDLSLMGEVTLSGHPIFEQQYQSWLKQENCFAALGGKELAAYYKILSVGLNANLGVAGKARDKEYGHWFMFSEGFLYAWSDKAYTDAEIKILERFKNVVELTFRRYIELQKSEAIARAAVREASLDRVRAEIASMRKRSDLERITPLIWDELTILGIPFIRCGVFIMDEEQKLIHTFLSTPDGKAIGAFHIPFDTSGNFEKMVASWRNKEPYIDHWKEEAFSQFADTLVKQGAIASKAQYMRTLPHEGVHLNFLPFLQGMLYVGNIEPLTEDNIDLIQAVAEAFSTAYARYEDFNKLEAAKQQVDNTLSDLKATQTRLIQSEKMASLGELTAGIAHEIQNPLNFVNNFSEVNQEMIDELADELKAGNIEEALAIASDIKDNEQKINHHGKRADGIVKGMLQHSRTGGGEKTQTNINALADEFMRLSYHGLRAKDKVFNAELVTHFDPNLPKISVIGQDIGRVLLNLFNNAFYAVNQKKKVLNADYKPEVTVTTSSENGQVIIKVKDNGVGMPDTIKEKIMQPFFTTKPTGEGTGLGLSLTYDMVVKGHGGTIQVNSREGEGSEFIIQLPVN